MNYIAIASTALFAVALYFTFRCKHAWTLVSDRDFPSRAEELKKAGFTPHGMTLWLSDVPKLGSKIYIAVLKCDRCGAIKTFKERS